jgi:polyisoprenoid-binding protein YceI
VAHYVIVPEQSRVTIDARSNLHPIHSETDGLTGYIDFDPEAPDQSGQEVAGKLSLPVVRLSSGNRLEDRELQKRINAKRFPTIDGVLTGMKRVDGDGRYRVSGTIGFRDATKQVEDNMEITVVDDNSVRLTGQSTFDIRDFGMEPPRILMLRVEPEVVVRVDITAQKKE